MATKIRSKQPNASRATQKGSAAKGAEKSAAAAPEEEIPSLDDVVGASSGSLSKIEEKLSRSVFDPVVSDDDVLAVVRELKAVPASEFKAVLNDMKSKGLLETLKSEVSDEDRGVLMAVLVSKGAAEFVVPKSVAPLPGQDHATIRTLVKVKSEFSSMMGASVEEYNKDTVQDYVKDRGLYVDRYREKILSANSVIEMREVGPPTRPIDLKGPLESIYGDERDQTSRRLAATRYSEWTGNATLRPEVDPRTVVGIRNKVSEFAGEREAGEVWLKGNLVVKFGYESDKVGGLMGVAIGGEVSSSGHHKVKGGSIVSGSAGAKLEHKSGYTYDSRTDERGQYESTKLELGELEIERDSSGKETKKVAGFKLESDGRTNKAKGKIGAAEVGIQHTPSEAEIEAGGAYSVGNDYVKAKLEVTVGTKGISESDLRAQALQKKFGNEGLSFFKMPPELKKDIPWSELHHDRRAYYEKNLGWDENQWAHFQKEKQPKLEFNRPFVTN